MAGRPKSRERRARLEAEHRAAEIAVGLRPLDPEPLAASTPTPSHAPLEATEKPATAHEPSPLPTIPETRRTPALGLPVGSDEAAVAVFELTMSGVPPERIAKYLECTVEQLLEHHQRQLDISVDEAVRIAGRSLLTKAKLGDVTSILAILKANEPKRWDRGKTSSIEVTGPGGAPLEVTVKHALIDRIMAAMPQPQDVTPTAVGKLKLPAQKSQTGNKDG